MTSQSTKKLFEALNELINGRGGVLFDTGISTLVSTWILLLLGSGLYFIPLLFIVSLATIRVNPLPKRFAESTYRLMITSILRSGRGLKSGEIRLLGRLLGVTQALTVALTLLAILLSYLRGFTPLLLIPPLLSLVSTLLILSLPRILVYIWASRRRVEVEVELPYLVILLRVLAELKLPIYDILNTIENSIALSASSREMMLARKVATISHTSLLRALDITLANHPSEKVVNYLRRIIVVATTQGDISSVAERVFDALYGWFESRISGLVGNFTIIVGTSLFVFLFIPVVISAIAPVLYGRLLLILGISLSAQVSVFFLLYAMILNMYPSSFIVKPGRNTRLVSTVAIMIIFAIALLNVFLVVAGRQPLGDRTTLAILTGVSIIGAYFSERELRNASFYDSFIRVSSDALSLAATTGENPASVLENSARKYGRKMTRFTRTILSGYLSEKLKKAIVSRAPSIFHAAYIETLMVMLRLGASPRMLRIFTTSYERLATIEARVRGFSRTLEAVMIGLSMLTGGFLAYINSVYEYIARMITEATRGYTIPVSTIIPFTYDPMIYQLLDSLSLLSLLFISIFVGAVRGGSYIYSFRPLLLVILVYILAKYTVLLLL